MFNQTYIDSNTFRQFQIHTHRDTHTFPRLLTLLLIAATSRPLKGTIQYTQPGTSVSLHTSSLPVTIVTTASKQDMRLIYILNMLP